MAKLKFYARADLLCNARPGFTFAPGQFPQYVGRTYEKRDKHAAFPATEQAFECDEDSDLARNLLRKMTSRNGRKDPPLYPADKYTAQKCQCEFVETEFVDGVHRPKPAAAVKPPSKAPQRAKDID